MVIEKRKKFPHIVGKEFKEQFLFTNSISNSAVQFFLHFLFNELDFDGEQLEEYEEELQNIEALKEGEYFFENGDFTCTVTLSVFND